MQWTCPACKEIIPVNRPENLNWNICMHIYLHERRAGQLAVDKARRNCTRTYCEIGTPPAGDSLTEYDRKFLADVKIKVPRDDAGH